MIIKKITACKKNLALKKPYTIAYETCSEAVNVFLEIELSNGITGIGSAAVSEYVLNETLDDTLFNLQSDQVQKWKGNDIRQFRSMILESHELFPDHRATCAAIDIAMHDAFCRYLKIPVADFYGRKHRSLPTSVTIGICDVNQTIAEAAEFKDKGFTVLKIKTGHSVEEDIERCIKLRERFGDYFSIRVDANQGYDAKQTMHFIHSTRSLGLELVEQPVPVGAEHTLSYIPEEFRKIIACDESLKDAASALFLVTEPRICGIFNIKLMKCRGILGAFDIAVIGENSGTSLFWGCYDESIVSISAALHAAYTRKGTRYLDLDGSFDLAEDVVEGGFTLKNGKMYILDKSGFGFEKI